MDDLKCFHPSCTVSPRTGGAVYRINAKGVDGIWACAQHMKNTDAPPPAPDVVALVDAIRGTPQTRDQS